MARELPADAAKALAARLEEAPPEQRINRLYRLTYGRDPDPDELTLAQDFLSSQPLEQLAHVLLISNELMFVD